jgi:hypothetical protein
MHRSPSQLTLREKLSEAERLTRELMDHVEKGFIPRAHELRRVTRQGGDSEEIADLTVRSTAEKFLESDQFARNLCGQLQEVLGLIQADIEKLQGRR